MKFYIFDNNNIEEAGKSKVLLKVIIPEGNSSPENT